MRFLNEIKPALLVMDFQATSKQSHLVGLQIMLEAICLHDENELKHCTAVSHFSCLIFLRKLASLDLLVQYILFL